MFNFVKHLFSLYICPVISSLVFIFMFGVAARLLFYCDFMNLAIKIKFVTANVDKPLSFPSRWSWQLKVCKVFSIIGLQTNSARLSFFCSPHLHLGWQVGAWYVTLSLEL